MPILEKNKTSVAAVWVYFQREASGDLAEKSHKDGDEPFYPFKPKSRVENTKELYQDYLIHKEQKEREDKCCR